MNKDDIWQRLEQEYKAYPEDFGEPVKDIILIYKAQEILKLEFSTSYKNFLQRYGSALLPGHIIYGLSPLDEMGDYIKSVVDKTIFFKNKQKWPGIEEWYIISDDGFGNPIGIDTKGKVWLSDHDAGFEKVKLADSFEDFLYKILTDSLYE